MQKPCCTVNHPQGYPKFLAAAYVKIGRNGLGHALLSPSKVQTDLGDQNTVTVICKTTYPFGQQLVYTIKADKAFDFFVRVPNWYIPEISYVRVDHEDLQALDPDPLTGMHKVSIGAGTSTLKYELGARVRVEARARDTVAVYHGALLYALDVGADISSTRPRAFTKQPLRDDEFVPETRDYSIENTTAWAVAVDPTTLKLHTRSPDADPSLSSEEEEEHELPNPIFERGAPPTFMTVQACEIEWGYYKAVPDLPPLPHARRCTSKPFTARLIPYGAAKIHMAELPTMDLSSSSSLSSPSSSSSSSSPSPSSSDSDIDQIGAVRKTSGRHEKAEL